MNGNFLTISLFSYFKEITSGCETFLPVFFLNLLNVKVYIHRNYTCIISTCIIKSIGCSMQGSSIRIDRFIFGSTLNPNKLDEKVKILGK